MHSNFFRLDRQVSIVTGASRGIGKAIALAHAQYGANVVVSSRNLDACKKVVDEISSQGGVAAATEANISKKGSLEALIDFTLDRFGQIDHLVCNAASNPFYGPLSEIPDDAFEKILKNNILSNHWLASLSSRHISKSPSGSIVIVSSIAGLKGTPGLGAYAVSKAADMQLVRNLSLELGSQNIRVNGIAPGLIKTELAHQGVADKVTKYIEGLIKVIRHRFQVKVAGGVKDRPYLLNIVHFTHCQSPARAR